MKNKPGIILKSSFFSKGRTLILVFICIAPWFSCTHNKELKTEEEQEREMALNNKIKTIKIFETQYRNGVAQTEFLYQVRTYNAEGLRTEEINYNDSIRVHSVIWYEYDNNSNLVSRISKGPDSSLIFRETRTYNNQNKREELIFYLPDGTYKYRNIITYDNMGNPQQMAWYWPDGLRAINRYSYKQGLKVEDTEYDPLGKFNYKWVYSYDGKGNQTQAIQYYAYSVVKAKIISLYNNDNQLKEQTTLFGESVHGKFVFEYKNNDLLAEKKEYSSLKIVSVNYRYQYEFK